MCQIIVTSRHVNLSDLSTPRRGDSRLPRPGGGPSRRHACLVLLAGLGGCASEPAAPPPLVLAVPPRLWDGESPQLATRLRGRVVVTRPGQGLAVLDLSGVAAGLAPMEPRPLDGSGRLLPILETSPPDAAGAVTVLTPAPGERRHALQLLKPGSRPRLLREGQGEPLWDRPVSPLALSTDGRRLAFVVQADPGLRYRPLHEGLLTVLDLAGPVDRPAPDLSASLPAPVTRLALGQRPGWLPEGTRLVYAAAGPRGRALPQPPLPERQPDPELRLLDLARGTDVRLAHGHSPLVSTDGRSVLFARGPSSELFVLELDGGQERPVPRRHGLGVPVAWIDGRHLLYTGTSHPQAPRGQTTNNSPLVGPKPMRALKVQDIWTSEVLTLLEGVDPRIKVTAGA